MNKVAATPPKNPRNMAASTDEQTGQPLTSIIAFSLSLLRLRLSAEWPLAQTASLAVRAAILAVFGAILRKS
jgi:hypothetical protein